VSEYPVSGFGRLRPDANQLQNRSGYILKPELRLACFAACERDAAGTSVGLMH
jgi:hypothetical protein